MKQNWKISWHSFHLQTRLHKKQIAILYNTISYQIHYKWRKWHHSISFQSSQPKQLQLAFNNISNFNKLVCAFVESLFSFNQYQSGQGTQNVLNSFAIIERWFAASFSTITTDNLFSTNKYAPFCAILIYT